jgi:hypothetical protein
MIRKIFSVPVRSNVSLGYDQIFQPVRGGPHRLHRPKRAFELINLLLGCN